MIVIGTNLVLKSQKIAYSKEQGFRTVTEYEGTIAAVRAFAFQLNATVSWDIDDSDAPKATLTISAPFLEAGNQVVEQPVDTWELVGNSQARDIYEHPNSLSLGAKMLSAIKASVQKVQGGNSISESNASYETAINTSTGLPWLAGVLGVSSVKTLELFDLILKGTTSYQISQFVLRYTRVVGSTSAVTVACAYTEYVYQIANINNEAPIPLGLSVAIGQIPAIPARTNYTAGWLKQAPTSRALANGKVEITTEWWLENWSNYIYSYL